jgi:hypothetical protein
VSSPFVWAGCALILIFFVSRGAFALFTVLFVIFLIGVVFMKLFGLLDR